MTKGTIIEVNVSDLSLVTTSGKVVWGKYAQVTNNPDLDGCIDLHVTCCQGLNDALLQLCVASPQILLAYELLLRLPIS